MGNRPRKHSLTLRGHRTSVSLEEPFWLEFKSIAMRDGRSVNELAASIDATRGNSMGLASAIRLYILRDLQMRVEDTRPQLSRVS